MNALPTEPRGPVAWMAGHGVAANILMVVFLIGGFVSLSTIKQELFPDLALDMVTVSMSYPGASPQEVEEGILLSIEEAVRFVIGLIADEVEQERCELSPIHYVSDPAQLDFLAGKLHASKIGVKIDESIFTPRCSAAFCLSWIAKARRRSKAESGRAKK